MKWSFRRRVEALTLDEIDQRIDEHQARAKDLISQLAAAVEKQGELWREIKERDHGGYR